MKFYDTNALLDLQEKIFETKFVISSVTLHELEKIKTSFNKDEDVKYKARKIIHLLNENETKYDVIVFDKSIGELYLSELDSSPDNMICACAALYYNHQCSEDKKDDFIFVTNDLCCKIIARNIFELNVESTYEDLSDEYTGYKEIIVKDEDELAYFYEHQTDNVYDLLINEYLVIRDKLGSTLDTLRWTGEKYDSLSKKNLKSFVFGDKIKPKDIYQSMCIDSLLKNTLTVISGKAGSGKSLLSLMVAMYLVDSGSYDRIVVMFNPTKSRGASDMGFYGGDFLDKALQNSIGQILTTKFGDRYAVDLLIQQDKLKLVSMADARGMEIRDNEILYITESQNTSIDLLKLCLSRASSGCKIILEGDYNSQTDSYLFAGSNNGMKRAIDVLKGEDIFGYVQLQNVWRSKIATLVDKF